MKKRFKTVFEPLTKENQELVDKLWRCPDFNKQCFKMLEEYLFSLIKPNSKTDEQITQSQSNTSIR